MPKNTLKTAATSESWMARFVASSSTAAGREAEAVVEAQASAQLAEARAAESEFQ